MWELIFHPTPNSRIPLFSPSFGKIISVIVCRYQWRTAAVFSLVRETARERMWNLVFGGRWWWVNGRDDGMTRRPKYNSKSDRSDHHMTLFVSQTWINIRIGLSLQLQPPPRLVQPRWWPPPPLNTTRSTTFAAITPNGLNDDDGAQDASRAPGIFSKILFLLLY